QMKTKVTLILFALLLGLNVSFAQQDEECMVNLTMMDDYAKNKKYDQAYEPFMKLRNKCPKFNYAIYAYGERILKHKIDKSSGAERVGFVNDYMKLLDEGLANFPNKYTAGGNLESKAMMTYDEREALGYNNKQIYDAFDKLYKEAPEAF